MITLIGVGHVFGLDKDVKRIIHEVRPNAVCLELDRERFLALKEGAHDHNTNPLFNMIERFQNRVAKTFGATPGSEMMAGAEAACEVGAKVLLIDRDIRVTVERLLRLLPLKEKVILLVSGISSLFATKKKISRELERIQNDDLYLEEVTREMPVFRRVLIEERNEVMAHAIIGCARENHEVIAIIGDGHIPGVERILRENGFQTDVIRLRDIKKVRSTNRVASYRF